MPNSYKKFVKNKFKYLYDNFIFNYRNDVSEYYIPQCLNSHFNNFEIPKFFCYIPEYKQQKIYNEVIKKSEIVLKYQILFDIYQHVGILKNYNLNVIKGLLDTYHDFIDNHAFIKSSNQTIITFFNVIYHIETNYYKNYYKFKTAYNTYVDEYKILNLKTYNTYFYKFTPIRGKLCYSNIL
jgi:hypothetical protein